MNQNPTYLPHTWRISIASLTCIILLLTFTMTVSSPAWAECTAPYPLILRSQSEVDNFQLNYGPCDSVYSFRVSGADIVNLDGLSALTYAGAGVLIHNNPKLTDISGLANLTTDWGGLVINYNNALTHIDGLAPLTSWGGPLVISSNAALTNIDGLANLTNLGGRLGIEFNAALTNFNGLANLISIGRDLNIKENAALTNIDGLINLISVGSWLEIRNNDALTNINGLANLTYVGDNLIIESNAALTQVDGLINLTDLRDSIYITENPKLTDINGLANLSNVGWAFVIESNNALTNIDSLTNLTSVGGNLNIGNNALTNLNGLANLTSVGGNLIIVINPLTNLNGLANLTSVGRNLHIQANWSLDQCTGLSRLVDQWDDAEPGPGPGVGGVPDVGSAVLIGNNLTGCNSIQEILATVINAGHSGAWFNPETPGQGQMIDVEPESRFLFFSWFTFTDAASANPYEQHWFTAQGNYSGNTANLTVYETLGGQFDGPQEVNTDSVGNATLSFSDCGNGNLDYVIDTWGIEGSFPLQRAIPGTENACEERAGLATEPLEPNDGRDGAWFEATTPGQGFLIDAHPGNEFIFVAWFTYGAETASGQRWLTAQGPLEGSTADLVVYETVGGSFDDPAPSELNAVGTMTIDFTDCRNAQLDYSITDEVLAGIIDIERAIPGTESLCEELSQ